MPRLASLICSRALPVLITMCAVLTPWQAFAQRAADPSRATVFIRVIGKLLVERDSTWSETFQERDVELGTGTGFVFTPYGHVLTNHHVIEDSAFTQRVGNEDVDVELIVERVEVVLPGRNGDGVPEVFRASVDAVDPERDLAVLSIQAGELPYLALGDSIAAREGDAVRVYGFPMGRKVEVARSAGAGVVPRVSVTAGSVSAARLDDAGQTAYLQTNATVNPGNSGGPLVDHEGFVVGVVRLKLKDGDGIGFAIPIELVKDFLEFGGFGGLLPTTRLTLGPEQSFPGKALALRLPDTMEDVSPSRLSVFNGEQEGEVRFRAERVASPWSLDELEQRLLSGDTFSSFRATAERRPSERVGDGVGGFALVGSASGRDGSSRPTKMEFLLMEHDLEKIVLRYEGSEEAVAFNRSVLQTSLQSIRADWLLRAPIQGPLSTAELRWVARDLPLPGAPSAWFPGGWEQSGSQPFACPDLPRIDSATGVLHPTDFTVSLSVGWWAEEGRLDAGAAAEACGSMSASLGAGLGAPSYRNAFEWLGVQYAVEGVFVRAQSGLIQLEAVMPFEKRDDVRALFEQWVTRNR